MPNPIGSDPTDTPELAALESRLKSFIAEGHREIFAPLTNEEHRIIIALCFHSELGADILAQQLRHFAMVTLTDAARWSERAALRYITFKTYLNQVRPLREAAAEQRQRNIREAANIVELATRRPNSGPVLALNPNAMVAMNSPRMRATGLLLLHRAGRLWADTFSNQYMTDWSGTDNGATVEPYKVNDEFFLNVAMWLAQQDQQKLGNISVKPLVMDCVSSAALKDKRNAPRDYLNSLSWDGVARLESLFSRGYGAPDSEFNRVAGRCWFVGMVARILRPGCQLDTMPVLIGRQGIFKTQSLRVIGGDWYREASSDIHNKDFKMELWGALVFEIQELHSIVTSNASAAKVKSVISTPKDHFRKSYGYAPDEYKRTACFVGTTNNRDWHHDESGEARRFWPIHCGVIDIDWITESRDQLFAEARVYFELPPLPDGKRDPRSDWWTVPREAQQELMDAESGEDAWASMIAAQLDRVDRDAPKIYGRDSNAMDHWDGTLSEHTHWGNLLTVHRIALQWLRLNTEQAGKRNTANRIGAIMRRLGWHRVQQRMPGTDKRVRVWLQTADEIAEDAPNDSAVTAEPVTEEDDIPF